MKQRHLALQALEMFVGDFLELLYRLVFLAAVHRSADCRFADRGDYRYDVQKNYDTRMPAVTFYVTAPNDVRGAANLEPRVVAQERV